MSVELISIPVLVTVFLVATVLPINMGASALVAAYVVGVYVFDLGTLAGEEENIDGVFAGFPGDLFVIHPPRRHLPVRHRARQRHRRLAGRRVGEVGGRAHRDDSVGHVRSWSPTHPRTVATRSSGS